LLEQEVKLVFDSVEAARHAVRTAGGRLVVSRRLLADTLFDTPDDRLRRERLALRVRRDGLQGFLTFKGPTQPGLVKTREEIETSVGSPEIAERLLRALGFQPSFRSEKYRDEYELDDVRLAIDETPIGVFVEIEGEPDRIELAARQLGRTPADYRLESYARLFADWCRARGLTPGAMVFAARSS
jgi:adenylate cyclase, class 2